MRSFIVALGLLLIAVACFSANRAAADDAELRFVITNLGVDVGGQGQFHLHPAGDHDSAEVGWASSGEPLAVPAGAYDVFITFNDGAAHKEFWIDKLRVAGKVEKTVELKLPIAEVSYTVTNGGVDAGDSGQFHLRPAGQHDGTEIAWSGSKGKVRVPAGAYDVLIMFNDGAAHKEMWLDNQTFAGEVEKTVEINLPMAEVRFVVTNGGADVADKGQYHIHAAGHHDDSEIAWGGSGSANRIPAGVYDVRILFEDGPLKREKWLDNQKLTGKVDQTVEVGANEAVATVRYVIANGGVDVADKGQFHIHPAGQHDGSEIAWEASGGVAKVLAGAYDILIVFNDGAAHKEIWLDNQSIKGKVDAKVEINLPIAEVRYVVTNGGVDTQGAGQFHLHPAGQHDGTEIGWSGSGGDLRLPAGAYDVLIMFNDGAAHKEVWIDNQAFKGKVAKSVEINLAVADVGYAILNHGEDVKDKGQFHIVPAGQHEGSEVGWAGSGGRIRLPAGDYDVAIQFVAGMFHKTRWLDRQTFSGKMDKTVELGLDFAEPAVSVTAKGADVGDKATVGFIDPATHEEIGAVRSAERTLIEAGTYDVRATLFGAEGWLRGVALAGKQDLAIEVKPLKTETLKAAGPPPKACVIEIYGVNFDFNKSALRSESEPVLKRVLALFTDNPGFKAEVGGHTDNVGTPEYNARLSDARAAAVKGWLVAQGVAADRVSSHGYGDTRPLLPNTTDENRFKNRRVELRTEKCR